MDLDPNPLTTIGRAIITYDTIDKIRKVIQPDTVLSRSQTISILVNEKARKLNGKAKEK